MSTTVDTAATSLQTAVADAWKATTGRAQRVGLTGVPLTDAEALAVADAWKPVLTRLEALGGAVADLVGQASSFAGVPLACPDLMEPIRKASDKAARLRAEDDQHRAAKAAGYAS